MSKRIAIDIGHARGTGAAGNGLQEHEVCAEIAEYLRAFLETRGVSASVIDYPTETNSADLIATVREVNAGGYALSVSLHCDCSANGSARGAHCIYVSVNGGRCAEKIAKHLCPIMPGRANRTVKRGNLYVLNNTRCPAVLVECGFLSNSRDADMLKHEKHRIAMAIGRGVIDFLTDNR